MPRPLALLMAGVLFLFDPDGFVLGAALLPLLGFALVGLLVRVDFLQHGDHGPVADPGQMPVLIAAAGALAVAPGVMGRPRTTAAPLSG